MVSSVRDSEAVHEVGLDVEGIQHMVDIRAASMDEDDIDADEAEEKDVLHDGFLQFRIGHCISAVLGNDVFSCVFFDVRDRLGEDLGAYCLVAWFMVSLLSGYKVDSLLMEGAAFA